MALPTIRALALAGERCWVAAPAWGRTIYRELPVELLPAEQVPDGARTAVLLAPSFGAAWRVRRLPRRVGLATDGRWPLLSDAVVPGGGHRARDYAALAAACGVRVRGAPRFRTRKEELDAFAHLPEHIGLNPVSRSGHTVQWPHFEELARALAGTVRVYAGPGEEQEASRLVPDTEQLAGLPLGALAGALSRCRALVSNDSGIAHFAAACGRPVVVIHGSTAAYKTGSAGAVALEAPVMDCRPCYRKRCPRGVPCLGAVGVEQVLEALP